MHDPKEQLKAVLAEIVAESAGESQSHPSKGELYAYVVGELANNRSGEIRRHTILCRKCQEDVMSIRAFLNQGQPAVTNITDKSWPRLRARLRGNTISLLPWTGIPPQELRAYFSAAACLCLAVVVSIWAFSLNATIQRLIQPQQNTAIVELLPEGGERGGSDLENQVKIRDSTQFFTLALGLPVAAVPGEQFKVEISSAPGGEGVWQTLAMAHPDDPNLITLTISARFMPPGRYSIQVYAQDALDDEASRIFPVYVVVAESTESASDMMP